jgi:hypothetical protein
MEIRLESLDYGPGLLPFNLGPTKLITHYHSFLQCFRLDDIDDKISLLRDQILTYESKLPNNTYSLYELQIRYLNSKLESAMHQLKSLEPNRSKRGLIDGLGSVIKGITGNLDHKDAIRYNKALSTLYTNQSNLASELNNHISIDKEWTTKASLIITQLVENQSLINQTLVTIIDETSHTDYNLIKFAKFAQLLLIISENVVDLLDELVKIENSLAFIHASTTHRSMISISILNKMLSRLREIYGKKYILDLEAREYYDVIKPGSYFIDKQLIIVYRFPIISLDLYDLYMLSITPNKFHQAYIPSYPFIATNHNSFVYMETECPKFKTGYLCDETFYHHVRTQADCTHQLILNQSLETTCNLTTIKLTKEAMEKIDDQHYTISLPHLTRTRLTCEREDYVELQGSYLVTLPLNCILRTPEFTIINKEDEVKGQPLKIMMIPEIENPAEKFPEIQLNSIDLRKLHGIQKKISLEKPLNMNSFSSDILYHTTGPFYGLLIITVIAIAIFFIHRYKKNHRTSEINDETETTDEPTYTQPERVKQHPSATFSLNVLK